MVSRPEDGIVKSNVKHGRGRWGFGLVADLLEYCRDAGEVSVRGGAAQPFDSQPLERHPQARGFAEIVDAELGYRGPPMVLSIHEPFLGKKDERPTDWPTADVQVSGQLFLDQPLA